MKIRFTNSKIIRVFFLLSLTAISYRAITYSSSAPPAALTGAPSDGYCTSCHSGSVISSGSNWANISLTTNIPTGGYTPGTTYTITYSLTQSGITRYGFEATVLSSSNAMAGSLTAGSGSTLQTSGSRTYISHNSSGTLFSGGTGSWTFSWTAPSTGVGTVTFYTTMNAANNNGSETGDQIYTKAFTFGQINVGPPTAVITTNPVSATVCVGDTLYFSGSGINLPTGYAWSFGSGATPATSTLQNPKVVYSTAGTFSTNLHTTNSYGTSPTVFKIVTVLAKPSAIVTPSGNLSLCGSNDSIVLNAPIGSGLSYVWYPTNDTSSSIVVKSIGTYRVTVTNSNNCTATSANINISQHSIPTVSLTSSADSICQNDTVTFYGSGNFLNYRFYLDTTTVQNSAQKSFKSNVFSSSNLFTIIATDSFGCKSSISNSKSVLVRSPLASPITSCGTSSSNSVQFNWTNLSGALGYNISSDTGKNWQVPSSGSTGLSHTISGLTGGKLVTIKVRAITQGVCTNSLQASQTCQSLGCPYTSFVYSGPLNGCLQSDTSSRVVNMSISNVNAIKYSVNINNTGYISNASVPVNIVNGANAIHIKIIDSLNMTCPIIDSVITITGVNSPSTKPVLSFSNLTLDTLKQFCLNSNQTLYSNQPIGGNKYFFMRNSIDTIQYGTTRSYLSNGINKKYNNNDIATVIVMDTNYGCYKISSSLKVIVNPLPKALFNYSAIGKTLQFTDSSIGKIQSWNWSFGDNSTIATSKNPLHTYATKSSYDIWEAVIDSNGCVDTAFKTINVTNTGIHSIQQFGQITIYPIPVDGNLNISFENTQDEQISFSIFDMNGRLVFEEMNCVISVGVNNKIIQTESLNKGIYLLKIDNGNTQKLVKFLK
jgi:PKD repeat protein